MTDDTNGQPTTKRFVIQPDAGITYSVSDANGAVMAALLLEVVALQVKGQFTVTRVA